MQFLKFVFLFWASASGFSRFATPNHSKIYSVHRKLYVVDPSFVLAEEIAGIGVFFGACCVQLHFKKKYVWRNVVAVASLSTLLACGYVTAKTNNVRFNFDETEFQLVKSDGSSIGEHPIFSGEYRWGLGTDIVNYGFLPSSDIPIFLYLKENKTPPNLRIPSPIVVDNLPGQVHIFPMIGNSLQLKHGFQHAGCQELPPSAKFHLEEDPSRLIQGLQLL